MTKSSTFLFLLLGLTAVRPAFGDEIPPKRSVKIGLVSVLSGDLAILGKNVVASAETYRKHYAHHDLKFVVEDSKINGPDGLRAYQKIINQDHVDVIVGASSSNGTVAAKALINSSKTPTISVVTGGTSIDHAGRYIFRIGNSDTLNGVQEAEDFAKNGILRVAALTEETEYTQDVIKGFRPRFKELGGTLCYDQNFLPGTNDFRTEVTTIRRAEPKGVLVLTQTGMAFGIFVKQWHEQRGDGAVPIHTSFTAAPNPDARTVAGEAIYGTHYMAPRFESESAKWKKFSADYREDHQMDPPIGFHSAGTFDSLALIELYLDSHEKFDRDEFVDFLLEKVKDYQGLMGKFSFDSEGNANLGFEMATITKEKAGM